MRLPRVLRRIIWPLTTLLVLVVSGWLVLLSPPMLTKIAASALESATGVPVEVRNARWDGWSELAVDGVTVSAPGWPDEASKLLEIEGFRSVFRPLDLLAGRLTIEDLEVRQATLCLAQRDLPDGSHLFNLSVLAPKSGGLGPSVTLRPNQVKLDVLRVKNLAFTPAKDEHGRSVERQDLVVRAFRADMSRRPAGGPHDLGFELVEIEEPDLASGLPPRDRIDGVRIEGEWNDVTFAYRLDVPRVDFTRSVRPLLPPIYGRAWDTLGVKGTVSDLVLRGDPQSPLLEARFELRDAAINLGDFGLREDWWRFRSGRIEEAVGVPRMEVEKGTVVFRENRFALKDFAGKLLSVGLPESSGPSREPPRELGVPLPARLDLTLDFTRTPPPSSLEDTEAWLEDAIEHAGFEMNAVVPDFSLRPRPGQTDWVVELPRVVVNILDNFRVRGGSIGIAAHAARAPSDRGAPPNRANVSGSLRIRDGEGSYVNFPYPLTGVDARIDFEDDQILVRRLEARGSGGCGMLITGSVDGTGDDAGVDLTVQTTTPAPIDQALQNSFQPGPRRIFELLFARSMRESLVRAGLLPEEGTELGGTCDFRIQVQRPKGAGDRVVTTGTIGVRDARVLCSRFPYPIAVQEGHIELEDERIVLPKGTWRFTTAGGGEGRIHGEVAIPRKGGERDAQPDLHIVAVHDRINPLLLAALPLDAWDSAQVGWPGERRSEIADAMEALGMSGELEVAGAIGADAEGRTTLDLRVFLRDGAFRPRNGPARLLERSGLPWPEGFDLDGVDVRARVTERRAWLERLTGRAGDGVVRAEGAADLRRRDRWLRARLDRVPLGLWLPRMLPDAFAATASEAWDRCKVRGFFDADILVEQPAEGPETRRAILSTEGISLVAGGRPCRIDLRCGHLVIDGPSLDLIDVEIDASESGRPVVAIRGDGAIALGPEGMQDLEAEWRVDALASPLLSAMLEAGNLGTVAEVQRRWNATGSTAGQLRLASRPADPGTPPWTVQVDGPLDIRGDPGGVPARIVMEAGAAIRLVPGCVHLTPSDPQAGPPLELQVVGGRVGVGGSLTLGPGPASPEDMSLDVDVSPLDPSLAGLLPEGVARGMRSIALHAEAAATSDLRVLGWREDRPSVGLQGRVRLVDGSLRAGVLLERIDADFDVLADPGSSEPLLIGLGGGAGNFRVRGREFTSVDGLLRTGPDGRRILVERLEGGLYGGRVSCQSDIDPAADRWSVTLGFDGADLAGLVRGGDPKPAVESTGFVRGRLSLEGGFDEDRPPEGVGRIEADRARLAELPLTLRMLQASQLMLPLSDSLDRASVQFHLRGPDLRFDRFDLSCPTLRLLGTGSMDLGTWDVALRFRNRGTVPLLSDLFGAASDQLFVIDVTGPAANPDVRLTPLPPLGADPTAAPRGREPEVATRNDP